MTDSPRKDRNPTLKERTTGTTFYMLPNDHHRLRMIAAAEQTTLQSLLFDGIDLILAERGQPPMTRWAPQRKKR